MHQARRQDVKEVFEYRNVVYIGKRNEKNSSDVFRLESKITPQDRPDGMIWLKKSLTMAPLNFQISEVPTTRNGKIMAKLGSEVRQFPAVPYDSGEADWRNYCDRSLGGRELDESKADR